MNSVRDYPKMWRMGKIKDYVELLGKEKPVDLIRSNRYVAAIAGEVEADPAASAPKIAWLRKTADSAETDSGVRALLYYSLFLSTSDDGWLRLAERLALTQSTTALDIFFDLLKDPKFDTRDRARLIRSVYESHKTLTAADLSRLQRRLITYDTEALLEYDAPFFDHVETLERAIETNSGADRSLGELETFSLEAAVILIIIRGGSDLYLLSDRKQFWGPFLPLDVYEALYLEKRFGSKPLLPSVRTAWIASNKDLIHAWTEPGLATLRASRTATLRKIFHNRWVSESELH